MLRDGTGRPKLDRDLRAGSRGDAGRGRWRRRVLPDDRRARRANRAARCAAGASSPRPWLVDVLAAVRPRAARQPDHRRAAAGAQRRVAELSRLLRQRAARRRGAPRGRAHHGAERAVPAPGRGRSARWSGRRTWDSRRCGSMSMADRLRNARDRRRARPLRTSSLRCARPRRGMTDLRSISAGLQLPELDWLSVGEVAARAVRDYERKTGAKVALDAAGEPVAAAAGQDHALSRAAGVARQWLPARRRREQRVRRQPAARRARGSQRRRSGLRCRWSRSARRYGGLAGIRERVRAGRHFDLRSAPGAGTPRASRLPPRAGGRDD